MLELNDGKSQQFELGKYLANELSEISLEQVKIDEHCYVYGMLPATPGHESDDAIGFISHMDTSLDCSGVNVKPQIIKNYDGNDVVLQGADDFAYFNFERNEEYRQFFQGTKDIKRILANLSMASSQKITPNTLIIFDEIQACEEALNSLKYFCEDTPEYHVACARSLLGLQLTKGFPVGKVNFIDLGPMTFSEFLLANGKSNLLDYLRSIESIANIPDAFFNPLTEMLKMYFVVGGMPEAVRTWAEEGDINAVEQILSEILDSYENDFGKHAPPTDVPKIHLIWDSLPSQLARENKKFMYNVVKNGARAREYENALNWLNNANFVDKVFCSTKPGLPISAYDNQDAFKIYMVDVGLLRKKAHLATSAFAEGNRLFTEFKGALTENFVHQGLKRQFEVPSRYWTNVPYEVNFIQQNENSIFPIESKAGENVKAPGLKKYMALYPEETPLAIRLSMKNLSLDGKILNVPLFMIDELKRLTLVSVTGE